jgi:hypothetical protein
MRTGGEEADAGDAPLLRFVRGGSGARPTRAAAFASKQKSAPALP